MKNINLFAQRFMTGCLLVLLLFFAFLFLPSFIRSLLILLTGLYIIVIEWPQFNCWWLTPIYPLLSIISIILLNEQTTLLPFVILIVVLADTGAYCGGKLFGTHLMAPTISPKKTWEGLLIGLLASVSIGLITANYLGYSLTGTLVVWITCISIASTFGDLFESYLKRKVRIKDSGTLLPGHGGVLDRIDSLLFAAPVAYVLYKVFDL